MDIIPDKLPNYSRLSGYIIPFSNYGYLDTWDGFCVHPLLSSPLWQGSASYQDQAGAIRRIAGIVILQPKIGVVKPPKMDGENHGKGRFVIKGMGENMGESHGFIFQRHAGSSVRIDRPSLNRIEMTKMWVFPKIGVPQNGWFIMENPN